MADSVLIVADIDVGIFPDRCVLTGERTTTATHVWAWGRSPRRVPVPVTRSAFRRWRVRAGIWAVVTCFGLGAIAMSARNADPALAVLGVIVIAGSLFARHRARRAFWIRAEHRPAAGHVVLRGTHPGFDAEARRLFLRRR